MRTGKLMRRFKNKSYYFKIVLSFLVLCSLAVITTSMIFSNMYKKSLVNSTSQEYLDSLSRVNVSIENIIIQADSLYTNMKMNKDIYMFLNARESDMYLAYYAQGAATQTMQLSQYIHSICLYNATTDFFVSTGYSSQDSTLTANDAFKKSVKDQERHFGRIIERINLNNRNPANGEYVFSIKYRDFSIENIHLDSILINIDEAALKKDIFSSLEGKTIIINEDRSTLAADDLESTEDNKAINDLYQNAILKGIPKGNFIYDKSYVITYVRNDAANWYIVNIRPFSSITESIKNREILLYIICFSILLACIGISFFVSSRLYSPVRKVTEYLKKKMPPADGSENSEFPLITNIIEETFNQMNELAIKNNESTEVMKESLLRNLIVMEADMETERKLKEECPLKVSFDNLIIAAVKIDHYRRRKESSMAVMETIINTTILEVLDKNFRCETINMYQGEMCVMMNFRNSKSNSFEELLASLAEMKNMVNKLTGTTVTIGIGGIANNPYECNSIYEKARDMIKYRFVLGTDHIIYERYIEETLINGLRYPVELKEKLLISIRLNKKEDFEASLAQVIALLSKYVYADVVVAILKIILDCVEAMNEITEREKTIDFDFDEFNSIFLGFLTLQDAKSWLLRLFDEYQATMEKLNSIKNDKYYQMVEETKEFINENYGNVNLGAEMLADKIGYSQKYFSKVFKEVSGCYLSDYIRQVRISRAKELLCKDDLTINDIYQVTGFVNSSYFYTTFKNQMGMTPSEYRKFYHKS